MQITNPIDSVYSPTNLRLEVVEIGPWDMDAVDSISFNPGLVIANVIAASAFILNDVGTAVYPLNMCTGSADTTPQGGIQLIAAANCMLHRLVGGRFDDLDFDDAVMNRGYMLVQGFG